MGEPEQVIAEPNELKGNPTAASNLSMGEPEQVIAEPNELKGNPTAANVAALPVRHRTMEESRERMQQLYNIKAAKTKREKEREEKIEEDKTAESGSSHVKKKLATKLKMRPEYNPLTGDTGATSSCRWRPSRGASGGG